MWTPLFLITFEFSKSGSVTADRFTARKSWVGSRQVKLDQTWAVTSGQVRSDGLSEARIGSAQGKLGSQLGRDLKLPSLLRVEVGVAHELITRAFLGWRAPEGHSVSHGDSPSRLMDQMVMVSAHHGRIF